MNAPEKLAALRALMRASGVAALYVGTTDPHQTESVSAHWKAVQWLTGFTGSMGYAVVTDSEARLWTDGRYVEQAGREVDGRAFLIHSISDPTAPDWREWLKNVLAQVPGAELSLDPEVTSEAMLHDTRAKLPGIQVRLDLSLISQIWENRPAIPKDPVWEMAPEFAVETRPEKLKRLRKALSRIGAGASTLLSSLDDIAWLTNLRGNDNPLYPFFHAYALVTPERAHLFSDLSKFPADIQAHLAVDGWTLHRYNNVAQALRSLPADSILYVDPAKTPFGLYAAQRDRAVLREGPDLVTAMKARKTPGEQANIREANLRESVAVVRLMRWIEENAASGSLDEYAVGQKLEEFRRLDPLYLQPANIPIVGYGENAALPHYRPGPKNTARILPAGFLLFDVCAQYQCGTTDLTRTVAVGELTEEMRRDYTMALKAHITLARQKFPCGTTGNLLDAIAKANLWNHRMNFAHGTGHGMGYVLNVHEGPAKIITEFAPLFPYARETELEPGMLFSNEPGVYRHGRHGIRIENSILVQNAGDTEFGHFLEFETITFLPYERKAILTDMLSPEEHSWVNAYHAEVCRKLRPRITPQEAAWLKAQTAPI